MPPLKIISLLHFPGVRHNRSMWLYGRRLLRHVSLPGVRLKPIELPNPFYLRKLNEVVLPPIILPYLRYNLVHLLDHAHSRYLKFLKVPAMVTVHDLIVYKVIKGAYPSHVKPRIPQHTQLFYRFNIRELERAKAVITPSQAVAKDVAYYFSNLKPIVVPHGVDPEFFLPLNEVESKQAEKELIHPPRGPFILQISNGFFYKNDPNVLSAWMKIAALDRQVQLVRVGPLTLEMKAFISRNPQRIYLYHNLSQIALRYLYRSATLLLHPSWDEGFGWPPLEAMASGLPVVASSAGALAETAAPACAVVDPADPVDIAERALELLHSPKLREELRLRGIEHARTFTWERTAEMMVAIYRELLS